MRPLNKGGATLTLTTFFPLGGLDCGLKDQTGCECGYKILRMP